jgi:hypothetical protein
MGGDVCLRRWPLSVLVSPFVLSVHILLKPLGLPDKIQRSLDSFRFAEEIAELVCLAAQFAFEVASCLSICRTYEKGVVDIFSGFSLTVPAKQVLDLFNAI